MARKRTTTTVVEEPLSEAPETAQEEVQQAVNFDDLPITERLALIIDKDDQDYYSRVYRQSQNSRGGQPLNEFLERVNGVLVDEDWLQENYGGGRYFVRYTFRKGGVICNNSTTFAIAGPQQLAGVPQQPRSGGMLEHFINNLTEEKIAGICGAVAAVKKLFEPPKPAVDATELLKAVLLREKPQMSETLLMKALEGANRPQPQASPLELVQQAEQIKALVQKGAPAVVAGEEDEDDKEEGTMSSLIEKGLKLLPMFLNMNGGNFEKTGAAFRDNEDLKKLIVDDPKLADNFVAAARAKYGDEKAQALARGFGLEIQYVDPETEERQQLTQQTAAPAAAQGA